MTPTNSVESPVYPGDKLDQYRIDSVITRGDISTVYRATDLLTGSEVAIKVPNTDLAKDPAMQDRFHREVEIAALLDHPGVIKTAQRRDRTKNYIVMESFDGKTLRAILEEERKLSPERAISIAAAIGEALQYVHEHGIVHVDIRPEKVMVGPGDAVKLIDFGNALRVGARRFTLTKLSQSIGNSKYISPEELKGKRADARSDVYALGEMLYEMLTGKLPFGSDDLNERLTTYPVPPREIDPSLTPQLQEVIYRALESDPHNRYAAARDFANDLRHLDLVGVADRTELRDWKKKREQPARKLLTYLLIALIPLIIFALLLYVSRH